MARPRNSLSSTSHAGTHSDATAVCYGSKSVAHRHMTGGARNGDEVRLSLGTNTPVTMGPVTGSQDFGSESVESAANLLFHVVEISGIRWLTEYTSLRRSS